MGGHAVEHREEVQAGTYRSLCQRPDYIVQAMKRLKLQIRGTTSKETRDELQTGDLRHRLVIRDGTSLQGEPCGLK